MQTETKQMGFTLIELLVVVTIIAILAGLLLPALFQSQQKAWQAGCQANMRNISVALHSWVEDHKGWLPPGQGSSFGLWCNEIANYNSGDKNHLNYYLATYLGCPAPASKDQFIPQFICPSFRRFGKNYDMSGRVVYAKTTGISWGETDFYPFGYPTPGNFPPQKMESVAALRPLGSVWVLVDADLLAFSPDTWGEAGGLPPLPSHVDQRNFLYFDGHIAAKKVPPDGSL
jgi:prepilin-type N-terminal cleavage/methylation domain-containing protein/prepilin-type processing-associated H-X9-DG protein